MPQTGDTSDIELSQAKQFAAELTHRDKRIVEIAGVRDPTASNEAKLNLVCQFDPEPDCDSTGYFWVAFLLTRLEFENSSDHSEIDWPLDLGFRIGEQVFLPNGRRLQALSDEIILWPPHED